MNTSPQLPISNPTIARKSNLSEILVAPRGSTVEPVPRANFRQPLTRASGKFCVLKDNFSVVAYLVVVVVIMIIFVNIFSIIVIVVVVVITFYFWGHKRLLCGKGFERG